MIGLYLRSAKNAAFSLVEYCQVTVNSQSEIVRIERP